MSTALLTLLAYALLLLGIGFWARSRSKAHADFLLGGRGLGPWVAGLSASASSSSAWTLLGVSGAAYFWGMSAIWLLPATLSGFVINWYFVAPRLRRLSRRQNLLTLTEVIATPSLGPRQQLVARIIATITLFCFVFYIASQFEGAAGAFSVYFDVERSLGIVIGVTVVFAYTVLGGFWAASVSDAVQGFTMLVAALVLPIVGLIEFGGPVKLFGALLSSAAADQILWSGEAGLAAAVGFIAGTLGIGLGYPGQPHVVNRFMALRDDASLRKARRIAITWALVIYSGMLLAGFSARLLLSDVGTDSHVLFEYARELLSPALAAVILAAVLSAIMSTADSQLLVAASCLSHDWHIGSDRQKPPALTRFVVGLLCVAAALLALYLPADIFSRVLFAWHALGSALGPLLLLRLCGYDVSARMTILSISCGFALTVVFNGFANLPGDWLERLLPLALSALAALAGARKTLATAEAAQQA